MPAQRGSAAICRIAREQAIERRVPAAQCLTRGAMRLLRIDDPVAEIDEQREARMIGERAGPGGIDRRHLRSEALGEIGQDGSGCGIAGPGE